MIGISAKPLLQKRHRALLTIQSIALSIVLYGTVLCLAQERPTILAGHGTLSGSILPLWVGVEAKLFEKHGLQVKPIYLPRAAGRPALLSGEIQVYFSAGPPLVQMRLSGADVAVTSCVVHKLTSKIMVVRRRFRKLPICAAKFWRWPIPVRPAILPPSYFWRAKA